MQVGHWQWTNVILLLITKAADTAHTAIFASDTRPLSDFWAGPGDEATMPHPHILITVNFTLYVRAEDILNINMPAGVGASSLDTQLQKAVLCLHSTLCVC